MENKKNIRQIQSNKWLIFISRTLLYTVIILGLVYLYHYSAVGGGTFIYNQF